MSNTGPSEARIARRGGICVCGRAWAAGEGHRGTPLPGQSGGGWTALVRVLSVRVDANSRDAPYTTVASR